MKSRSGLAPLLAPLAACAACGGDPVSYSAPVGIHLKARSVSIANGIVNDEKSINTEPGNPYGAFVDDARARIGRDPSVIDVDRVELLLGAASTGVAALGEVFAGDAEVVFQMNDTGSSYAVAAGTIDAGTAAGPIALEIAFPADEIPDPDYVKLLSGSFKVIVRGPAAPAFQSRGADADLQVTLTFAAFE